jgi:hypothetical protein
VHVRAAQDRAVQLEAAHDRCAGAACRRKLTFASQGRSY